MIRNKVQDNSGNYLHYPACVTVRMRDNAYSDSAPMLLSFVTDYEWTMLKCMRNYDKHMFAMSVRELYHVAVDRCFENRPTYYKRMPPERDFSTWIIAALENK